jgi:hypothetical protein
MPHPQNRSTHCRRDDSGEDLKREADAFAEEMVSDKNLTETVRLLMTLETPKPESWITRLTRRWAGRITDSKGSTPNGDRE